MTLLLLLGGAGIQVSVVAQPVALTLFPRQAPALTLFERSTTLTLYPRQGPALTLYPRLGPGLTLFPRAVALTLRTKTETMSRNDREVIQSDIFQGVDERIPYTINTEPWVSSPASTTVEVFSVNADGTFTDVTSTLMPTNSPSESGDVITLSLLRDGTSGVRYRVEVKFTAGGGTWEPWFDVVFER